MSHARQDGRLNPANAPSDGFFSSVAIAEGMRVLDVGCGNGDLSRFVAGLAGPRGRVVAIDRSGSALAQARTLDSAPETASIEYREADLTSDLSDLGSFDAIVGRRVLMYLPDAAKSLNELAKLARPGAILAFQEHGRSRLPAGVIELPHHRQLYDWVWDTVAAEGSDVQLAYRLPELLRRQGHSIVQRRSEAILLEPNEPSFLPTLARVMLPRFVESGIVSAADADVDTLAQQIEEEHRASHGTIVWDLAFFVSARVV